MDQTAPTAIQMSDVTTMDPNEYDSDATVPYPMYTCPFMPGDVVLVSARTGLGMNKPGGIGKVAEVNEKARTATVEYLTGHKRTEQNVPFNHIVNPWK